MRGTNYRYKLLPLFLQGSPPLARDKFLETFTTLLKKGITPACAGQMGRCSRTQLFYRDHPRLRGTNFQGYLLSDLLSGSPPLARDKSLYRKAGTRSAGITPACAGQIDLLNYNINVK